VGIRRPDRFLTRRNDRKRKPDPIAQGIIALGPAVSFEDIDDVPKALLAGVEAADVK
jgi:hypothetical protein